MPVVTSPKRLRRLSRLIELQNGRCSICLQPLLLIEANFDHHVPRSKGGRDWQNLRAAHESCNCAKGSKMPRFDLLKHKQPSQNKRPKNRGTDPAQRAIRDQLMAIVADFPSGVRQSWIVKLSGRTLHDVHKELTVMLKCGLVRVEERGLDVLQWKWFSIALG